MSRPPVILIFGENENDTAALGHIIRAIRGDLGGVSVAPRRRPLVQMKESARPATKQAMADEIARLVRAEEYARKVAAVVVHQDCDAVEPAHEALSRQIETQLAARKIPNPIAATPAWEMEAWLMLFPAAAARTRACWTQLNIGGRAVGLIMHAKEELRRMLRSTPRCPEYQESDAPLIAQHIESPKDVQGEFNSASFEEFRRKINSLKFT